MPEEHELRLRYEKTVTPLTIDGLMRFFYKRLEEELGPTRLSIPVYAAVPTLVREIDASSAMALHSTSQKNVAYEYVAALSPYHIIFVRPPTSMLYH